MNKEMEMNKTDENETRTNLFVYLYSFWLTAFLVAVRLKLTTQRLVLAKTSNKRPFSKMEVVGAYLKLGTYSRGRLLEDLRCRNICSI